VLSNESQAILPIQDFADGLPPSKRPELWVIESETGGLPLWDGVTEIYVRQALPAEEAKWQASRAKAIRNGNVDDSEDEIWLAFLVPLTDPDRRQRRK